MSGHQKRVAAPKTWPITRKTNTWIVNTNPGPHNKSLSMPLALIVRDMLKIANTLGETKKILNAENVLVDGRIRKNPKFPVGIFDVVAIPENKQYYRMLLSPNEKLELRSLEGPDGKKLCKITNKTTIKGGKVQLNLHDGTNMLATAEGYAPGDSLILSLPDKNIVKHLKFEEGSTAIIVGGKHSGETGSIVKKRVVHGSGLNAVTVKTGERELETLEKYVYVIGEDKPEIMVGERN
ncbi:MAG: 30S ribosomal protein S4e [Candidatus Argoarchaeum ethanivorans]|uniref:Small ribosomal subunit protein eS4 n=1 Tax=Candidatus Argoarchaeum ethanivorans TaxID=2608793 RepID=A0A811T665_9EURY|nr:MAG: 30S ribosomal protein S4e [Candidatus Argoarchaeum ethanivorans]